MKLYNVSVELVAMVMAETPDDAKRIAMQRQAMRDDFENVSKFDLDVTEATYLPGTYSADEYIYHDSREEITVRQAAERTGSKLFTRPQVDGGDAPARPEPATT
jgi:hypothetical protein